MLRLFLIGLTMGTADLIPGISGGTVAFIAGIYERLLNEIKTLSFRNFSWKFFLPLGGGIAIALLGGAHVLTFLLREAQMPLYAFFLGVIVASTVQCLYQEKVSTKKSWGYFLAGACAGCLVSGPLHQVADFTTPIGLVVAGFVAIIAMLLPGISGCYMLHLLGVYPLVLKGLTNPLSKANLTILVPVGIGIFLGMLSSVRAISYLLKHYRASITPFFIGCMIGGTRSLWVFELAQWWKVGVMAFIGIGCVFLMRFLTRRSVSV